MYQILLADAIGAVGQLFAQHRVRVELMEVLACSVAAGEQSDGIVECHSKISQRGSCVTCVCARCTKDAIRRQGSEVPLREDHEYCHQLDQLVENLKWEIADVDQNRKK